MIVSIIKGVIVFSIVFNFVGIQGLNSVSIARDTGLAVNRAPDETFRLFETYKTGVDAKEIQERLHWLAVFLDKNPDFNGFIVSYAGQRACSGEAMKRANIARQFLITNEG